MKRNKFFQLWNETQETGEQINSPADMTFDEFAESSHRLFSDFDENEDGASYLKLVDNDSGDVTLYRLSNNDDEAEKL